MKTCTACGLDDTESAVKFSHPDTTKCDHCLASDADYWRKRYEETRKELQAYKMSVPYEYNISVVLDPEGKNVPYQDYVAVEASSNDPDAIEWFLDFVYDRAALYDADKHNIVGAFLDRKNAKQKNG